MRTILLTLPRNATTQQCRADCLALKENAAGGDRSRRKVIAAMNKARRYAWSQAVSRHGQLPPVRIADRQLTGITCIRLDATVVPAHSEKEKAEPDFKGFGHHPLLAGCDNVREPLAWMMRPGSASSNTAVDHLKVLDEAIAALPPAFRRKLMITCVIRGSLEAVGCGG